MPASRDKIPDVWVFDHGSLVQFLPTHPDVAKELEEELGLETFGTSYVVSHHDAKAVMRHLDRWCLTWKVTCYEPMKG